MCGIAGIIPHPNQPLPDLRQRLARMAGAMRHRGPDDEGLWLLPDGRAGLANRRLAIRDLSPAGHMPMVTEDGRVAITYNGEIFNAETLRAELQALGYLFRSHSDTEVILRGYQAWGAAVVPRLRGQFALAVVDAQAGQGQLLLARDHLGIKPLYVAQTAAALVFASELKALLASGLVSREIAPAGLVGYLLFGSVPNPLTIYREVTALEPASQLQMALDNPAGVARQTYWQLPMDEAAPAASYEETVAEARRRLLEAVRIRLVSDVPLGAFLSGGLDSSAVVAAMRAATDGPIRTCAMLFEEAAYSEAPYAQAVAAQFGAEHFARVITADEVRRELGAILQALDQPSIDGVNSYFVSQTARQAGLTVALSGLGGDELFGGYPNTFGQVPQMARALRLAQALPGGASLARSLLGGPKWTRVRDALAAPASLSAAYLTRRGLFSPSEAQALVGPELWQAARPALDLPGHVAARAGVAAPDGAFNWISRAELRTYTHHQLLRDTDVMSMAHSLEVRVPLLDVRLVEWVLRLPAGVKTNHATGPKPLLLAAIGPDLPALVRQRQDKQGFTFPLALWLGGELKAEVDGVLAAVGEAGWLRPAGLAQVQHDFAQGRVHWSRLWALVALGSLLADAAYAA